MDQDSWFMHHDVDKKLNAYSLIKGSVHPTTRKSSSHFSSGDSPDALNEFDRF